MLRISSAYLAAIRRYSAEAYPFECCGVFIGTFNADDRAVDTVIPCTNAAVAAKQTRYEIHPHELIRAQREARERGLEIVGFYHSHPDHPAQPSPADLEHAHWVGCSYLIVSVSEGKWSETKSFLLAGRLEEDKHFVDEELSVDGR